MFCSPKWTFPTKNCARWMTSTQNLPTPMLCSWWVPMMWSTRPPTPPKIRRSTVCPSSMWQKRNISSSVTLMTNPVTPAWTIHFTVLPKIKPSSSLETRKKPSTSFSPAYVSPPKLIARWQRRHPVLPSGYAKPNA